MVLPQISVAAGFTLMFASLQSLPFLAENAPEGPHKHLGTPPPKPSPSRSTQKLVQPTAFSSSCTPLQLSSLPLEQISGVPGFTVACVSLQSRPPSGQMGGVLTTVMSLSQNLSASSSQPSSTLPSQLLSKPSQTSPHAASPQHDSRSAQSTRPLLLSSTLFEQFSPAPHWNFTSACAVPPAGTSSTTKYEAPAAPANTIGLDASPSAMHAAGSQPESLALRTKTLAAGLVKPVTVRVTGEEVAVANLMACSAPVYLTAVSQA